MNITILDAQTLGNDADLSVLKKFGNLQVFQTTTPDELPDRILHTDVAITNKVVFDKSVILNAPKLKMICVSATGYNNIDIRSAAKRGVVVANVRNYSTEGVAQHTFSLILALENSLVNYIADTRNGNWHNSPVFTLLTYPFNEICGKKLGIIGYGAIGKRVAQIAKAFGMEILIGKRKGIQYHDTERVDFDFIVRESDIISIHTPLSNNTTNLFTKKEFALMKRDAVLINVARGGIVNENDLYHALLNKTIRAAAIDVSATEPLPANSPLYTLPNILITPHMAWSSIQSRLRLMQGIEQNIQKFLDGKSEEINLAI
jgi:glycerate dehydrogenase